MSPEELRETLGNYRALLGSISERGPAGGSAEHLASFRDQLLADKTIRHLLPDFVEDCRTPREFWNYIQPMSSSYAGRSKHIAEELGKADALLRKQVKSIRGSVIAPSEDWRNVKEVWEKAISRTKADPEGAITAARTLLESVCKHILDESGIAYPSDGDLLKLYGLTAKALNLAPDAQTEQTLKQILSGCISIANGIAALRNAAGDSHGKSSSSVKLGPRYAEFAVNVVGSLSVFLISTFKGQP